MTEPQAVLSEQGGGQGLGSEPPQRGNKWWTLIAVCLGTFMLLLDVAAVIALVSGVISLAAIRGRDFAHQRGAGQ